jgi:putative DNA primase/helicase
MLSRLEQHNNIPQEMKELINWLNWKLVHKPERKKPVKVPCQVKTLQACDPTNNENYSKFEEAYNAFQHRSDVISGCGFALAKSLRITAIDLDNCLDENGNPMSWTQEILDFLPETFIEISQSGKGLHAFLKGHIRGKGRKAKIDGGGEIEMYDSLRFMAITGNIYRKSPSLLAEGQSAIDALYEKYFLADHADDEDFQIEGEIGNDLKDAELMKKMFENPTNGEKITALWEGNLDNYGGDQSSADMALLCHLAFWTNRDSGRMEALFDTTQLSKRDKWQNRADYRKRSILEAIQKCKEGYNPGIKSRTSLMPYEGADILSSQPELAPYKIQHAPFIGHKARPNELAMKVLAKYRIITDRKKNPYLFDGQLWEGVDDIVLEALVTSMDTITQASNNRCLEAVSFIKRYSFKLNIPWRNIKQTEIPFKSGILEITDLSVREAKPEDYLETVIPHHWEPTAECHQFRAFLEKTFARSSEPEQLIQAIFDFIGYTLMQSAPYKKALLCVGPSNTGKTTFEKILIEVVGKDNICHIPIERMGTASELAPIKGKMLNVVGEIKATAILDDAGFKQLVSIGEPVQLNEKYKARETYVPFCKHAFFTNNLPTITDSTDAVFNRFMLIPFDNVVSSSEQDPSLADRLIKEIPGILVQAVKALKRLIERRGQFTVSNSSKDLIRQYKREQNPMYDFLESCFHKDESSCVGMETVRQALYLFLPRSKNWSTKKITQLLVAAECDIRHTTVQNRQGKFLFGYKLLDEKQNQLISRGVITNDTEQDVY